jgi:hypothetical protein
MLLEPWPSSSVAGFVDLITCLTKLWAISDGLGLLGGMAELEKKCEIRPPKIHQSGFKYLLGRQLEF